MLMIIEAEVCESVVDVYTQPRGSKNLTLWILNPSVKAAIKNDTYNV